MFPREKPRDVSGSCPTQAAGRDMGRTVEMLTQCRSLADGVLYDYESVHISESEIERFAAPAGVPDGAAAARASTPDEAPLAQASTQRPSMPKYGSSRSIAQAFPAGVSRVGVALAEVWP